MGLEVLTHIIMLSNPLQTQVDSGSTDYFSTINLPLWEIYPLPSGSDF